jgi:tetratricopeptide (TPR) repeat protein
MKDQGNLDEAEVYYKKSLVLAQKLGNKRLIAGNYNNLGNVERRRNKHRKALEYFFKALEMNKKSGNVLWESFNYHNIGNAYSDLKEHEKAIDFFKMSNKLKLELGDSLSLVTGYLGLSDAYAAISDYKNAYAYLRLHSRLEDTLQIAEQAAQLKELEAIYESEKKEAEILQLTTEKELEEVKNGSLEMKAQKNRNLLTLAIFAGLILLVGIGLLWRANKSRRKANDLLNSKNELIEKSNVALQSALGELSEKNKEIIDSINYATYIQRATLPNITQHTSDSLQFELFFAPKDIVSGDFYFSYQLYNKSIFGVADCTGHGVPGAMVSVVGMNSLEKVIREEKHVTTGEMVESLNVHVVESLYRGSETLNDGMDISFCHFDHENNMLHFTGANHTAYILRQNSFMDENVFDTNIQQKVRTDMFTLLCLNGTRRPIGKSHSNEAFAQISIKLLKGDRVVLFSDGYADQIGGDNAKKLKKGALLEFILRSGELPVSNQAEFMNRQFDQWKGDNEQVDDVCMLFVEVKR